MTFFAAGDVAVLRYVWFERPFWAVPARVVEDGARRTVLWVAPGTPYRRPERKLTMDEIAANAWSPRVHQWHGNGALMISDADQPYSVWLFWNADGTFASWYVNLELPWRRTADAFESRDHQLDIVVAPDRSWRWKDEDELRDAVDAGLLSADEARRIRADGERSSHPSARCSRRASRAGAPTTRGRLPRYPSTPRRPNSVVARSARTAE